MFEWLLNGIATALFDVFPLIASMFALLILCGIVYLTMKFWRLPCRIISAFLLGIAAAAATIFILLPVIAADCIRQKRNERWYRRQQFKRAAR